MSFNTVRENKILAKNSDLQDTQYKETVTVYATEMSHLLEFSYTISASKAGMEFPQFISPS